MSDDDRPYVRQWAEGEWSVAVRPSRSGKRWGHAIHGPHNRSVASCDFYGSAESALRAGINLARMLAQTTGRASDG